MRHRIDIPQGIRLVVLDMDGTIYRKPHMAHYMLRRQWRHLPSLIAERLYRRRQRKALKNLEILKSWNPEILKSIDARWYTQSYLPSMVDIIATRYRPEAWLQPLLDECRQRQIKVAILSDYEAVTDKLHALHLSPDAFAGIYAASEAGTIQPAPRLGAFLMERLYPDSSARPAWSEVLFIGDRPDTDGALANALGAQYMRV